MIAFPKLLLAWILDTIYWMLSSVDNLINHTIIDWLFSLFDSKISFWIWEHTSYAYCTFVHVTLGDAVDFLRCDLYKRHGCMTRYYADFDDVEL